MIQKCIQGTGGILWYWHIKEQCVGLQNFFPRKQCDQELALQEGCKYLVEEDLKVL